MQENRELKALLRKYYNKVHGDNKTSLNDSVNSNSIEIPSLRKSSRSYTLTGKVQSTPVTTILNSDNESPLTAQPTPLQSQNDITQSDQILDTLERSESHEIGSGGISSMVPKIKSLFSRKEVSVTTDKDSLDDNLSEPSISSTPSEYSGTIGGQNLNLRDRFMDLKTDNKIHTVNHIPPSQTLNRSFDESPLHFRKAQTVCLDSSGLAKTVENLLEKECI